MKSIIVFTNCPKLSQVDTLFRNRSDVKLLTAASTLLWFDENERLFKESIDFSVGGLYFVFDKIPHEDFQALSTRINDSDFYVLKHGEPTFDLTRFVPNIKEGEHESKGKYYPDLVRIISDSDDDKVNRIIKRIFKFEPVLEAKLELLYNSIFPQTDASKNKLDELLMDKEASFGIFTEKTEGKAWNDEAYVNALTELRNSLLGS